MRVYEFIAGVLAVWRITHLLAREDGPGAILESMRRATASGGWGKLLECFYCLSLWVAVPFTLLIAQGWRECALLWPALSGAAILTERLSAGWQPVGPGYYVEDQEENHVLRQV